MHVGCNHCRKIKPHKPALTSKGKSNPLRASFRKGRFSNSTAPATSNITVSISQISLQAKSARLINFHCRHHTFQKGDGELICVQVTDILAEVCIQYPGNKSLQHYELFGGGKLGSWGVSAFTTWVWSLNWATQTANKTLQLQISDKQQASPICSHWPIGCTFAVCNIEPTPATGCNVSYTNTFGRKQQLAL